MFPPIPLFFDLSELNEAEKPNRTNREVVRASD